MRIDGSPRGSTISNGWSKCQRVYRTRDHVVVTARVSRRAVDNVSCAQLRSLAHAPPVRARTVTRARPRGGRSVRARGRRLRVGCCRASSTCPLCPSWASPGVVRAISWVCSSPAGSLIVFARQVSDAAAAGADADAIARHKCRASAEVEGLERELDLIERQEFITQQARLYRPRASGKEIPFTLDPDAPPLPSDAPGLGRGEAGRRVQRPVTARHLARGAVRPRTLIRHGSPGQVMQPGCDAPRVHDRGVDCERDRPSPRATVRSSRASTGRGTSRRRVRGSDDHHPDRRSGVHPVHARGRRAAPDHGPRRRHPGRHPRRGSASTSTSAACRSCRCCSGFVSMFGVGGLFATQVLDIHGGQAAVVGTISGFIGVRDRLRAVLHASSVPRHRRRSRSTTSSASAARSRSAIPAGRLGTVSSRPRARPTSSVPPPSPTCPAACPSPSRRPRAPGSSSRRSEIVDAANRPRRGIRPVFDFLNISGGSVLVVFALIIVIVLLVAYLGSRYKVAERRGGAHHLGPQGHQRRRAPAQGRPRQRHHRAAAPQQGRQALPDRSPDQRQPLRRRQPAGHQGRRPGRRDGQDRRRRGVDPQRRRAVHAAARTRSTRSSRTSSRARSGRSSARSPSRSSTSTARSSSRRSRRRPRATSRHPA